MHKITFTESLNNTEGYQERPFQINGCHKTLEYLKQGYKRILAISPTGTGKTTISKMIALCNEIREVVAPNKTRLNILFIAHRQFLLNQAQEAFSNFSSINLTLQSAHQRISDKVLQEGIDLVFIDEAHHEAMTSIQQQLEDIKDLPIIGLTANDFRGDGKLLKFERVVVFISKQEAMDKGYNSIPRIHSVMDYSGSDKSEITIGLVREFHHHMNNTLIFMRTQQEVSKVYQALKEDGHQIAKVDSSTSEEELGTLLNDLAYGNLKFVVNCNKIGEGMDAKNITDCINAKNYRISGSGIKEQEIGRTLRPDCESRVWELVNPLQECALANSLVGRTLSERLIWQEQGEWKDKLLTGTDPEWTQMRSLNPLSLKAQEVASLESASFPEPCNQPETFEPAYEQLQLIA